MTTLEKILQEIEQEFDRCINTQLKIMAGLVDDVYRYGYGKSLEAYQQGKLFVTDIIQNRISCENHEVTTRQSRDNDGWIPVEKRLPTREEFLKDDGRFILDDGNRRYQGLFDIYDNKFKFSRHISGVNYELFDDKCVIAWQPLPEAYKKEGE